MKRQSWLIAFVFGVTTASAGFLLLDQPTVAQEGGNTVGRAAGDQSGLRMTEAQLKERFETSMGVVSGRRLKPKQWPNGARVAVAVAYDTSAQEASLIDNRLVLNSMQQGEFGAKDGLKRLLRLHDKHQIPASFFVPAVAAQLYPDMIPSIMKSGMHEIGLHGWMHENYSSLSEAEQRRLLKQAMDYLEKATGKRPVGFVPPGSRTHYTTYRVARDLGVRYIKSYASDDPHELIFTGEGKASTLYGAPGDWNLNDSTYFGREGGSMPDPAVVYRLWQDEFDATYEDGSLLVITMHPPTSGRRSNAMYLDKLFAHMKAKKGVWFATGSQIVDYLTKLEPAQLTE